MVQQALEVGLCALSGFDFIYRCEVQAAAVAGDGVGGLGGVGCGGVCLSMVGATGC